MAPPQPAPAGPRPAGAPRRQLMPTLTLDISLGGDMGGGHLAVTGLLDDEEGLDLERLLGWAGIHGLEGAEAAVEMLGAAAAAATSAGQDAPPAAAEAQTQGAAGPAGADLHARRRRLSGDSASTSSSGSKARDAYMQRLHDRAVHSSSAGASRKARAARAAAATRPQPLVQCSYKDSGESFVEQHWWVSSRCSHGVSVLVLTKISGTCRRQTASRLGCLHHGHFVLILQVLLLHVRARGQQGMLQCLCPGLPRWP